MWALLVSFALTVLASVGLSASFYATCVICDAHLVPAVEVFIQQFRIPEDIAGVTLVAFGSAAPELFLNTVAAFDNTPDLSLPAVLGSAIIAFGLIPSLCLLCSQKSDEMQLSAWPILRETTFYLLGLATFMMAIQDGEIEYDEALGLILVYAVYVSSVAGFWMMANSGTGVSSPYSSDNNLRADSDDSGEGGGILPLLSTSNSIGGETSIEDALPRILSSPSSSTSVRPVRSNGQSSSSSSSSLAVSQFDTEDVEEVSQAAGTDLRLAKLIFRSLWEKITIPVDATIALTFPTLQLVPASNAVSLTSALLVLLACVVGISVLAYLIITFCKLLIFQIGAGTTTIGATLVSLGAEIPDTISSISLARKGHSDGAMAGAIGSQVINITLGVGLPALISCWLYDGSLRINSTQIKSLWLLVALVFVTVLGYAVCALPLFRVLSCTITRYTSIKKPGAMLLLLLWALCNVGFVFTNEEMIRA